MHHLRTTIILVTILQWSFFFISRAQSSAREDSLRREILRLALDDAEREVERTDLWHRLIPHVEISASLAAGDLLFAGPTAATYLLPKDAYRISVDLNLSSLFDSAPHEKALVDQSRRQTELLLGDARERTMKRAKSLLEAKHDTLHAIFSEELALRKESVQFHAMLFEQGKTGFDEILRAKLAFLAAKRASLLVGQGDEPIPEGK